MTAELPVNRAMPCGPVDVFLTSAFGVHAALTHALAAEQHGLGGVWLAEHDSGDYGQCRCAPALARTILGATKRLTVGTAACVFTAHDPIALGKQARVLGERFQLGVARGKSRSHHDFAAWLATLLDPPMMVRVAVTSMDSVALAAKHRLPLLLGVEKTAAEAAEMIERWQEITGVDHADHARVVLAYPCGSRALAEHELRPRLHRWLARKAARDWTDHVERLLRVNPIGPEPIPAFPRPICMVEAAGSIKATTELIAALANLTPCPPQASP